MASPTSSSNLSENAQPTNNTPNGRSSSEIIENYVQVMFLVILMLVIVIGNILVMLAYKMNRRLRTGTYTILVSLAFCDFLVGSVSLPMWISVLTSHWVVSPAMTTLYQAIDYLTALSSALHLTVICLERWFAISKPFLHQTFTSKQYRTAIGIAWLLALLISSLVFIPEVKDTNRTYIVVLVIVGFVLPMLIITLVNIYIFRVAKKLINEEPAGISGTRNERRRKIQKERRIAKTLVIITALFFSELLPAHVLALLGGFCLKACMTNHLSWPEILRLMNIAKWMQYSNSGINPFIYAFRDSEMRRTFRIISSRAMSFRPFSAVANFGSQTEQQTENFVAGAIAHV